MLWTAAHNLYFMPRKEWNFYIVWTGKGFYTSSGITMWLRFSYTLWLPNLLGYVKLHPNPVLNHPRLTCYLESWTISTLIWTFGKECMYWNASWHSINTHFFMFQLHYKHYSGLERWLGGQQHLLFLQRTLLGVWIPAPRWQFTANPSSRGSSPLLWSLWALHAHSTCTDRQNTHT